MGSRIVSILAREEYAFEKDTTRGRVVHRGQVTGYAVMSLTGNDGVTWMAGWLHLWLALDAHGNPERRTLSHPREPDRVAHRAPTCRRTCIYCIKRRSPRDVHESSVAR